MLPSTPGDVVRVLQLTFYQNNNIGPPPVPAAKAMRTKIINMYNMAVPTQPKSVFSCRYIAIGPKNRASKNVRILSFA